MNLHSWLLFGHILGAMAWLGGGLVLALMGLRVRRSADGASYREFAGTLGYVGPRVLMPGVVAVLVFGLWMVLESEAWDFSQTWIQIAIGLFAVAFVIGALYLSRVGIALGRAVASADVDAQRRLVDRWLTGYGVVLLILLVAVWDMVFKPGL
jgi:uncharacterized membrane protein